MGQRWGRGGARLRPSRVPPPRIPQPGAPAGDRAAPAPPLRAAPATAFAFACLTFSTPSRHSSRPPPTAPHPPPPPFFSSFLFFCFFPSSSSRLPRAAARGDGAVGCSRWRAARRGARGSSPGSRQARGVRAGTHNHAPRAGGRGAEQASRAVLPGRGCGCGPQDGHRAVTAAGRSSIAGMGRLLGALLLSALPRAALGSGGALCCAGDPRVPPGCAAPLPPSALRPIAAARPHCSAGWRWVAPPPPAAPHPALGRSPLFLWAGGDGLVVPRQWGGPASPRGLQHRAAFAAPRGPPVPRSLWGLSASARPCWGSELLGAGRGRCGLAGQSTATQEPQSAIQRGEPGPPPCGAATRDCCGVRAEAPRDGPPPPHRTAPH